MCRAQIQTCNSPCPSNQPHGGNPMLIDKISLTFNIIITDHQKYIASQLINLPKELDCGWFAVRGGAYKYAARLHVPLPKNDLQGHWSKHYVLLQADPRNGKGP